MTGGDPAACPVLETARLRLRIVDERDAADAARLMTPGVSQWLASWPSPLDEAGAAARLHRMREATLEGTALCFAIEQREAGTLIGLVMIVRARYDVRRGDLGYWLGERFHRHGYMMEAAAAAVDEAFTRLNLDAIEAGAQAANEASLAIMRRLGMRPIDERPVWADARGREERCAYYEITRREHAARRA
jgi:ribosomal-protein-alanine N-acetyltransferase